jgi:predicted ATPase
MRIDKIRIENFKNLNDFVIDFNELSFNTVIIGVNGAGKSNLLEALTIIFRNLNLKEKIAFNFSLNYVIKGNKVRVNNSDGVLAFFLLKDTGNYKKLSSKDFYNSEFLPDYVFGYYSGTSNRFNILFEKHDQIYRDQLINDEDKAIRPLFLATPDHAQFVLLAFFLENDLKAKNFLESFFSITGIKSIRISFKEPHWAKLKDPMQLWGAKGAVKRFFNNFMMASSVPVVESIRKKVGIGNFKKYQIITFNLETVEEIKNVFDGFSSQELFRLLESTLLSDLLETIDIKVNFVNNVEGVSFFDLSEGQRQLLTVLGLLRFTRNEESLFLLDEPDTQLNPSWAKNYLQILKDYAGSTASSQLIMTTHSPIVFSGLRKEDVIIMKRSSLGEISAVNPDRDPLGLGVSNILTSEFFDFESSFDNKTYELIKERRRILAKNERSKKEDGRLKELNNTLFEVDHMSGDRDRLYLNFLRLLSKRKPELFEPLLSNEELDFKEFESVLDEILP